MVMAVSRWSASAVAEVMVVSQLPRGCVLCAKKFSLLGLMVGVSAIEFALRTKNGPKSAFYCVLGEFCRGLNRGEGLRWANFVAHAGTAVWPCGPSGALHADGGGGFAALEAACRRVAGVSWF